MLTGRVATEAGWTYILCRPGQDDPFNVMATARLYEPAAIVIEDVDGFGGSDQQQNPMDVAKLLDAFDGIAAKGAKLVMVLTANHPERIHKGLLRPGRLDAVIHVGELDADGIRTLTQVVVGDRLGEVSEAEWAEFVTACEGYMPAFVREACERSVRYAISQGIDTVNGRALIDAAKGLRPQLDLMEGARERKNANPLDTALKEALGLNGMIEEALNQANIYDQDDDYMGTVRIG
jgi:ATP-dependent 26S proteasome regulatory subunit